MDGSLVVSEEGLDGSLSSGLGEWGVVSKSVGGGCLAGSEVVHALF